MLREKIEKDFKEALLKRDELLVSTLRLLRAAIFNKEKEKRYSLAQKEPKEEWEKIEKESKKAKELEKMSQLSDDEILDLISSEIKKRKEAILQYQKAKREDLLEREKKEIEILTKYLPEQLSEKEIEEMAKEAIQKTGAKELSDFGKVMKELMPKIKKRAEGEVVVQIVKKLLNKT
jgi:uncharacterized protein YqeY